MHRFFASSFCLLLVACGSSDDEPGSWGLAGKGESGGGKLLCQIDNRKVTLQSAGLQYTTLELCALNGRSARIAVDIRSQGTSRLTGVTGALDLVEAIIECEPAQPLCGTALEGYDPDPQGLGDPYGGSDEWLISDTRNLTGIQNLQLFVAAKAGTLEQYDVVEAYLTVKVYEIAGSEMTPDSVDSPDSATMLWSMCEVRNIHCPIGWAVWAIAAFTIWGVHRKRRPDSPASMATATTSSSARLPAWIAVAATHRVGGSAAATMSGTPAKRSANQTKPSSPRCWGAQLARCSA